MTNNTERLNRTRLAAWLWFGAVPLSLGLCWSSAARGQAAPRSLSISVLPALDYSSDDGFGYGVVAGVYRYGTDRRIYRWSAEPTVFFTSNGRREVSLLFDAPALLPALRLSALAAWERDCCWPYYGLGNATPRDPAQARPPSGINYYTYRRQRWTLVLNGQWRVRPFLRVLGGLGAYHNAVHTRALSTLLAADSVAGRIPADHFSIASVGPRLGLILDTRDHERDPRRGIWLEALLWHGGDFTRYSGTARAYLPVGPGVTIAGRLLGEQVEGDPPVSMLPDMGSSFREFPGLGGGKTVRGVLKARYLGTRRVLGNAELRWRGGTFRLAGQRWTPGVVIFADGGRVWAPGGADGAGLHQGAGAGFRLTWGDAFIVAVDVGQGSEAGTQLYVGLGHLF